MFDFDAILIFSPALYTPYSNKHQKHRDLHKSHTDPGTSRSYIRHKSEQANKVERTNHR